MGDRAGRHAAGSAHGPVIHSDGAGFSARSVSGDLDLLDLDNALRALMWRLVSIQRDGRLHRKFDSGTLCRLEFVAR